MRLLHNAGTKTVHYIFQAGDITCSHIYIAEINDPLIDGYLKDFTMVPIKVEGMVVQPDEQACQKAARDAANEIKKIGVPVLIKGKDGQEIMFAINEISQVPDYPQSFFQIDSKDKAQSFDSMLKSGMEAAMAEMAYEKLMKKLDTMDATEAEKAKIRQEATDAYKKGGFLEYLKKKAAEEKGRRVSSNPSPASLSVKQLAGYRVSSGSKTGQDHPSYQMKYEALTFGCHKEATMSMASNANQFDIDSQGSYGVSGDAIQFYNRESDASNSLVGLVDGHIVVGKTHFEGPEGMAVDTIEKVQECH